MKKLVFVSLVLAMLFTSCAKEQLSEIEVTNESGVVIERYSMNLETKQKQGLHQAFYSSSKLSCESNYVNDTLDGKRIWYYEDGAIEIEENFKMGAYDGVIKTYFEDGQLKQEGIYSNDQATGVWKTYYASGQLKEEVAFENSLENGPFVEYHESGAIKSNLISFDLDKGVLTNFTYEADQSTATKKQIDATDGPTRQVMRLLTNQRRVLPSGCP